MDEPSAVDARARRVAVDQGGQHGQLVALATHLHANARRLADGGRQPLRLDVDRKSLAKRGQHLGDELGDLVCGVVGAGDELLALATGERRLAHRPQRIAAQRDAVGEGVSDGRVRDDGQAEPLAVIDESRAGQHRLAVRANRTAIELQILAMDQPAQQRSHDRAPQPAVAVGAERQLDRQVGLGGDELRAVDTARRQRGQRRSQRVLSIFGDDDAFERQRLAVRGEAVAHVAGAGAGRGRRLPRFSRPAPGDQRRGNVLAAARRRVTGALPVGIAGKEGDLAADHPAAAGDQQHDLVIVRAARGDRARASQLHAARPLGRSAGRANGLEQRLQLVGHGGKNLDGKRPATSLPAGSTHAVHDTAC